VVNGILYQLTELKKQGTTKYIITEKIYKNEIPTKKTVISLDENNFNKVFRKQVSGSYSLAFLKLPEGKPKDFTFTSEKFNNIENKCYQIIVKYNSSSIYPQLITENETSIIECPLT
jgi:hypothetical protein